MHSSGGEIRRLRHLRPLNSRPPNMRLRRLMRAQASSLLGSALFGFSALRLRSAAFGSPVPCSSLARRAVRAAESAESIDEARGSDGTISRLRLPIGRMRTPIEIETVASWARNSRMTSALGWLAGWGCFWLATNTHTHTRSISIDIHTARIGMAAIRVSARVARVGPKLTNAIAM